MMIAFPARADADAFRLLTHGAAAGGQANAFAAQADDATALYYNPAGITQIPHLMLGAAVALKGGGTSFTAPEGASAHGDLGNTMAVPPPTNLYLAVNLQGMGVRALQNFSVGFAVIEPFDTSHRYPAASPLATATTQFSLPLLDLKPTVAYQFNRFLSVGVGADIYTFGSFWGGGHAEYHFISSGRPGLPPPGTPTEITGRDTSAGFNVSVLYTPLRNAEGKPRVNVGFVYRSQAVLHLTGQLIGNGTFLATSSTTLVLPQIFTGALAVWPIRDAAREWKVEVDVDYSGWHAVRNTDIRFSDGTAIQVPQNWRNAYTVMVGTQYKWLKPTLLPDWDMAVRAGYWYSQTPIPDVSFSPAVPDAPQHSVTVGTGFHCKEKGRFLSLIPCSREGGHKEIGLDVAYQAILFEARTVQGNADPFAVAGSINGTYRSLAHVALLNFSVKF